MSTFIGNAEVASWSKHVQVTTDGVIIAIGNTKTKFRLWTSTDGGGSWSLRREVATDGWDPNDNYLANSSAYLVTGSPNVLHLVYRNDSADEWIYEHHDVNADGTLSNTFSEAIPTSYDTSTGNCDITVSTNGVVYVAHHISRAVVSNYGFDLKYKSGGSWSSAGEMTDTVNNNYERVTVYQNSSGSDDIHITYNDETNTVQRRSIWDESDGGYTVTDESVSNPTKDDSFTWGHFDNTDTFIVVDGHDLSWTRASDGTTGNDFATSVSGAMAPRGTNTSDGDHHTFWVSSGNVHHNTASSWDSYDSANEVDSGESSATKISINHQPLNQVRYEQGRIEVVYSDSLNNDMYHTSFALGTQRAQQSEVVGGSVEYQPVKDFVRFHEDVVSAVESVSLSRTVIRRFSERLNFLKN